MQRRPNPRRRIAVVIAIVLALAGILAYFRLRPEPGRPFIIPGASHVGGAADFHASPVLSEALAARLRQNLSTGSGLIAWYVQENREFGVPSSRSTELVAETQILYGQWLAEQDDQSGFESWLSTFQRDFISPSGLVYSTRTSQPAAAGQLVDASQPDPDLAHPEGELLPADPATVSWPDTLCYLRTLAAAYDHWPTREIDSSIRQSANGLSESIGSSLASDSQTFIPTPAPTQDPGATPTPLPTATPTPDPARPLQPVIRLESLDLLTLAYLGQFDDRLAARYDEALAIAQGGLISATLPLYAASYSTETGGYVRFDDAAPVISLESALQTALHLAEVGHLDPRTLSWLKEHLLNDGALYESYHIVQGQATSPDESLTGYALTARMARIAGDQLLYDKAVERLAWHIATSQTSQVRDAVFRQSTDGTIRMLANDNVWALLALS